MTGRVVGAVAAPASFLRCFSVPLEELYRVNMELVYTGLEERPGYSFCSRQMGAFGRAWLL